MISRRSNINIDNSPTPIIVIGRNRSGTKWLSNILCNCNDVIGMQRDLKGSGGMMETNLFGNLQRVFPSLSGSDEYVGFIELWTSTDFFKQTGLNKEFLLRFSPRPTDVIDIFGIVMNELAEKNKFKFWIQKTSPFQARKALKRFTNSRKVIITRNIVDTIRSQLGGIRRNGVRGNLLKEVYFYVLQGKILNRLQRDFAEQDAVTEYEKLKQSPELETRRICSIIGLDFTPDMLEISFSQNTSFKNEEHRDSILNKWEEFLIRIFHKLFRLLPFWFMKLVRRIHPKSNHRIFVPGTFASISIEHDLE